MLNNLGIGRVTASGFPGEASGTLDGNYDRWRDIRRASLSYGYGVDVTLLQLASIYSVLANKGIKNHVSIERIEGEPVSERVLSEETAKELLLMLEQVVENGVRRAKVNGYRIGGKTGTVQIYSSGYSNKSHNGIFVGIAPISEPRIVTAVIVNEPGGDQFYGGQVAAPIFSSITSASLRILGIAPDKVNN
jgi:cell division protein FtsI (penicillin-binding protein 3)